MLSNKLRKAEKVMLLREELETHLREGFLLLQRHRTVNHINWPVQSRAEVVVDDDLKVVHTDSDKLVRAWCLGEKPPKELIQARKAFLRALELALETVQEGMD